MDTKYGAPIAAHIARRWVLYKQSKFACYVASLRALLHDRKRLFTQTNSLLSPALSCKRLVCRDLTNFAEAEKSSNAPSTKFVPGKSRTKIDLINKTVITCRSYVVKAIAMEQKEVDCFAKLCWPVF